MHAHKHSTIGQLSCTTQRLWRSGGWAPARVSATRVVAVCVLVLSPAPMGLGASWGSATRGLPPAEEAAWIAELSCGGGGLAGTSTPSSLLGDWVEMTTSPPGCVFYSSFPTIHMRGSTASSQSLLRRKRFLVGSRITHKCLLESVTVTQVLKQFPISNADGHIAGPRPSFSTGLSVCTSTQCALQHIKSSASCVWVTYP